MHGGGVRFSLNPYLCVKLSACVSSRGLNHFPACSPAKWRGSGGLPDRLFLDGWLSPYPEENPNFYKQSSVYIPSCSSDLWIGNSTAATAASASPPFSGKQILKAVLEDLATGSFDGVEAPLQAADSMVVGGGPGAMLLLAEIRALLPKAAGLKAICDGCVLPNTAALAPAVDSGNGTTITFRDALDVGAAAWNLAPPVWCNPGPASASAAACLLADKLLPGVSHFSAGVDLVGLRPLRPAPLLRPAPAPFYNIRYNAHSYFTSAPQPRDLDKAFLLINRSCHRGHPLGASPPRWHHRWRR